MNKSAPLKSLFFCLLLTTISGFSAVNAADLKTTFKDVNNRPVYLSRGEATSLVMKYFELEKKNAKFLAECKEKPNECLFTFSAMTNFKGFKPSPAILYPDVGPGYKYYTAINQATQLDLVRGYFSEENSPYRPAQPISRVEALKLIMGAGGVMNWKEKFELNVLDMKPNWLTASIRDDQWWYARYIGGAINNGIITSGDKFSPEQPLSREEFLQLLKSTNKIVARGHTESSMDNHGQDDKEANTSGNSAFEADSSKGQEI